MKKLALLLMLSAMSPSEVVLSHTMSSAIHVWVDGDVLSTADINSNFSHIHGLMVGGHGARLINADVSASAGISHSKLATPGVLPKSIFVIGSSITPCAAGTCTLTASAGIIPTVTWNSTGNYTVTLPVARTDIHWFVTATPKYCNASTGGCYCNIQTGTSTTVATIQCFGVTVAGPAIAAANTVVGVAIFDNDN